MLAKKIALGFGIAIILPLLVYYGVSTFSSAPKYQDYYPAYTQNCNAKDCKETQKDLQKKAEQYRLAQKTFERHLFYVSVPVGVASILFGALSPIQAIGTGLMFGGIFTLSTGYIGYWSELADWMRFLSLLIGFTVLMYVGYRKLTH